MINQAPIVRYMASVSDKFFPNSWRKTFSAESMREWIATTSARVISRHPRKRTVPIPVFAEIV